MNLPSLHFAVPADSNRHARAVISGCKSVFSPYADGVEDGSLSVVESAPFDGIFKFSCPPPKAEPHHFARFLVDKDEKMAAQSDGFFIFGMLQFLWVDLFSDGLR